MMSTNRTRWFVVAICVQVFLILGMGLWKQSLVWRGREITLEASPVDPWDPFRGDYVSLSYKVGQIPIDLVRGVKVGGREQLETGDVLYVDLQPGGEYWTATKAHSSMPNAGVFLKGRVQNIEYDAMGNQKTISLAYGIESWFVQRGEGKKIENGQRGSRPVIASRVVVTPEGVAILRSARIAITDLPKPNTDVTSPMQSP